MDTARLENVETIGAYGGADLAYGWNGMRSLAFGYLCRWAVTIVANYHSDLYHDAMAIREATLQDMQCGIEFLANECGTHILRHGHLTRAQVLQTIRRQHLAVVLWIDVDEEGYGFRLMGGTEDLPGGAG